MSNGRTEEGQEAITQQTGDSALITEDGLDHVLEGSVDDLGPLLGVQITGCRSRTRYVTE